MKPYLGLSRKHRVVDLKVAYLHKLQKKNYRFAVPQLIGDESMPKVLLARAQLMISPRDRCQEMFKY